MKTNFAQIIVNAEKGVALLRGAQVGSADMETRKSRKVESSELLKPFVAVNTWPSAYQAVVKSIENEWFNLI